jgi:hypothetical protein
MRRVWATASVIIGTVLLAYAVASFLLEPGGEDASEAIGGLALLLGGFLVAEGLLTLRRLALLPPRGPPGKP